VSAEAGWLTGRVLAASRTGFPDASHPLRMMFVADVPRVLMQISCLTVVLQHSYVSTKFAKLTSILISPSLQKVRLGTYEEVSPDGKATVYVRVGAFHKPVKCLVMNLLLEVDMILEDEFMSKYNCILHYGCSCLMIRKGKDTLLSKLLLCTGKLRLRPYNCP
jgi:hypothetical protein